MRRYALSLAISLPLPSASSESDERLILLSRIAPLFALAYAILWWLNLDTHHAIPRDGTTLVVGRDFLNFWMAGRAAWGADPARFYDLAAYQTEVAKVTGAGYLGQVWSYPPSVMLLAAPFGLLPYLPALLLWTLIGPLVFFLALRQWTKDPRIHIALLLCPAAVFGLISGQFAYFASALILMVLRWRNERPWLAGALLGLLTIKPQLGLFFPVMLLASRDWKVIAAAIISTVVIILLSIVIWGPQLWIAYLSEGVATQSRVLTDPQAIAAPFMPTVFMNLRSAGVSVTLAGVAQAAAALIAAGLIVHKFWKSPPARDWNSNCLFLACALFGTPYVLSYDTLPLTAAAMLAMPPGKLGRWLLLAIYFLTLLQLAAGSIGLPGTALAPLLLAIYLTKLPASSTCVDQRNCPTGRTHSSE